MKTVIEMAREAGFAEVDAMFRVAFVANENNLERFAELVRADEREACAKVAERFVGCDPIADKIRARGNT